MNHTFCAFEDLNRNVMLVKNCTFFLSKSRFDLPNFLTLPHHHHDGDSDVVDNGDNGGEDGNFDYDDGDDDVSS